MYLKIIVLLVVILPSICFSDRGENNSYQDIQEMQLRDTAQFEEYDFGPAPPLSYLEIASVVSEEHPNEETIAKFQQETLHHHGGSYLQVNTVEMGYGINLTVTMNGHQVPLNRIRKTRYLCQSPSGGIHDCNPGEYIVGFLRTWDVSGYGNGNFVYSGLVSRTSTKIIKRVLYIR